MGTTVITGANRGIGLELTKMARERGDRVIGVCRNGSDELKASGAEVVDGVDVTEPATFAAVTKALGDDTIDVLVNNAGVLRMSSLGKITAESLHKQFVVNAMGPVLFTQELLPKLKSGSKVFVITSRMGSIEDNGSGGSYGYRMSKAAVNAGFKSLALDVNADGITVGILHPGFVKTEMTGGNGNWTPSESAEKLWKQMDRFSLERSGTFRHADGTDLPW